MGKATDFIDKFLKENSDLFASLSQNILCPRCRKVVKPPFKNLGILYHQAEGCMSCYHDLGELVVLKHE